ncbi:MAG: phytanoyl-CoA dioxygenase family protein [Bdellovibrionia bacterium]
MEATKQSFISPNFQTKCLYSQEVEKKAQEVLQDGYSILPRHIPESKLLAWRESFLPLLHKQIELEGTHTSRGSDRYYVTLPFTIPFADPSIFEDDSLLAILDKLVGKDPALCQLATDTPLLGSDYQDIHRDTQPLFPEAGFETPPFQLAVNFPLVDVTLENGPLEVARKTHMVSKEKGMQMIESGETPLEQVLMKLGDVMIRDVRGLHRGTPNRTRIPRPMVVLGYSRRWYFRPEVSIRVPRTELEPLSQRARHLLRFNPVVEKLEVTPKTEVYQTFAY